MWNKTRKKYLTSAILSLITVFLGNALVLAVGNKENKTIDEFVGDKILPNPPAKKEIIIPPSKEHKIILYKSNKNFKKLIKSIPSKKTLDYRDRVFLIIDPEDYKKLSKDIKTKIRTSDELNRIIIRGFNIDTTLPIPDVPEKLRLKPSNNKQLYIVQFAGPILGKWRTSFNKQENIQTVTHIKNNSLLVFSTRESIKMAIKQSGLKDKIQWTGPYHPAYRISPEAKAMTEGKVMVTVQILPHDNIKDTLSELRKMSTGIYNVWKTKRYINVTLQIPSSLINDIGILSDVVYVEPYNNPDRGGERQTNIIAGMHNGTILPQPKPAADVNNYLVWIENKLTPSGSTSPEIFNFAIDIADGGIDRGNTNVGSLHSSFHNNSGGSRLVYAQRIERTGAGTFSFNNSDPIMNEDTDGHGTMMASVATGYPTSPLNTDNYRHGIGVAPFALIGSTKIFEMTGNATTGWVNNFLLSPTSNEAEVGEGIIELYKRAYAANARISVNSWGDKIAASAVYSIPSQMIDEAVRDANLTTNSSVNDLDEMLLVFLAGNSPDGINPGELWGWGSVAKNTLVVGGSESYKQDTSNPDGCGTSNGSASSIQDLYPQSAWGPVATSNRKKPDLLAPATRIYGAATQASTYPDPDGTGPQTGSRAQNLVCEEYYPSGQTLFTRSNGTSFAAPATAGAAANLRQWLTSIKRRSTPSPALLKAWLMNTTDYLSGNRLCEGCTATAFISPDPDALPSNRQGMGLLNTNRILDSAIRFYQDQNTSSPFTSIGVNYVVTGTVQNTSNPFKVTVAWTDASGDPVDGGALKNDLNLQVSITDTSSATTFYYRGNDFDNDIATTTVTRDHSVSYTDSSMGNIDTTNNVESIWVPASTFASGGPFSFNITVAAATLGGDGVPYNGIGNDQDFALIAYNAYVPANIDLDLDDSSTSTGNDYSTSFTEDVTGAIAIADNDVSITNVSITPSDQPITTAIISITSPTAGEVLSYDETTNPNISTSIPGQSITLTGDTSSSIADFESAINQVMYNNTSDTPTTGNRMITVVLSDGLGNSNTATTTINVTSTNDPPIAANDGSLASPLMVTESIAESITGFVIPVLSNDTDIDGTLDVTSVNITSGPTFGSAIENSAGSITYTASPDYVGTSQFSYTVNDNNGATSNIVTVFIDVTPSNDSPEITAPSAMLFQLQNTTMVFAPANTLSIGDVDVDATTGMFDVTISVPAPGNGTFNATGATAGNGTNSISFSGNLSTVNAALVTLSYTGNTGITGTETVTINVNDNGNSGAADEPEIVSTTFNITLTNNAPPVLELDSDDDNRPAANNINFENTFDLGTGTPIDIAEGTTITDADTPSPVSVTATLTNPLNGSDETLTIAGSTSGVTGNIAFSYSSATLTLSANGGATPTNAEYATAIDLIRYDNNAATPDTTNRIISITVSDGISTDSATSTIDFQRRPVDIALVLDKSGSMQQLVDGTQRIDLLKDAVQLFLETWDGFDLPEDRLGTVYFGTNISTFPTSAPASPTMALELFDQDPSNPVVTGKNWFLHNADVSTQTPGGWTSLGGGLQTAIEGLNAAPSGGLNRKPVVITFTDGQQNGSPMVMRASSNYAPGDPVPTLDALIPYQILDATISEMVDDGFSVRALSGLTQTSPAMSLSSTDIPMNIHTIGTGVSGSNLEAMLSKLAADTGGEDFFATPADFISVGGIPSPLQDHFMTTLVNSLSETSLEMVGRVFSQLPANTPLKSHKFTLNNATQRASFVLSWNKNISLDKLAFGLKTPQGNFIPAGTRGIDIRSSDYYFIVHLKFPLISRFGSILAGGEWEMILQRKNVQLPTVTHSLAAMTLPAANAVDYSVWVLEDESDVKDRVKSDKPRYKVGEAILLTTKVTDIARAVKKLSVSAKVSAPKISLGTYLAKNYIRDIKTLSTRAIASTSSATTLLDAPQTLYDKNLSRLLNSTDLAKDLIPLISNIRLRDDGKNGDKLANDGIYSALYTNTKVPGAYRFDISIRGRLPVNGSISRETNITVVTEFDSFDINKSIIKYSDIDPQTEIKNANKQLLITPVDKFGNLLGPGKSQLINITIKNGDLVDNLQDRGDGSYVQYILADGLFSKPVISIDAPGATMIAVDTQDEKTLTKWVLIAILIIILAIILCWLIKRLYRLLKQ